MKGTNSLLRDFWKNRKSLFRETILETVIRVLIVLFGVAYSSEVSVIKKRGEGGGRRRRRGNFISRAFGRNRRLKTWLACLALYFSESWRDSAINFPFPRAEFVFRTKKKLGPRDKAILPVFESSIIGAARYRALYFRDTQRRTGAQQCRPCAGHRETPLPQRNYWSTVGVIAVIAPPETDLSSNYSKAFSIPPPSPPSCSFSITLLGTRTVCTVGKREGGRERGGMGGCRRGNSREGTQNVEGTEGRGRVALLSYRNGVARSQPFNELGQLTLYAQSFPAFRFYVNFNSLPPNRAAKECGESVRPRIRRIGPSLSTTTE